MADVELRLDSGRIEVILSVPSRLQMCCRECHAQCPRYDKRQRRWRHLDTCQYQTVLVADVPIVDCPDHGIKQVNVPWAEGRSRFAAIFEILMIGWLKEASGSAVSRQLNLGWNAVDGIMQRAISRGLVHSDDSGLYPDLDVDETDFRKRHHYVTVISDPGTGAVVHLSDDRKMQSLKDFYAGLSEEQRQVINTVSKDMWPAFINAMLELIPGADKKVAFDRFYVAQHIGNAVDKVRCDENKRLRQQGTPILTGTTHDWLSSPQNVPKKRKSAFRELCDRHSSRLHVPRCGNKQRLVYGTTGLERGY